MDKENKTDAEIIEDTKKITEEYVKDIVDLHKNTRDIINEAGEKNIDAVVEQANKKYNMTRDEYLIELGKQYSKLSPEQLAIYDKNYEEYKIRILEEVAESRLPLIERIKSGKVKYDTEKEIFIVVKTGKRVFT